MTDNFFDKFKLQAVAGEVNEGESYPLYGIVTSIIEETDKTSVVLNYNIKLNLVGALDPTKLETLRARAFEPGIFVSTITKKDLDIPDPLPGTTVTKETEFPIEATCTTIVYGKKHAVDMN